jgi:putative phage-type endonuclease
VSVLLDATHGEADLLGVFEPGSPEWHEARRNGVGGSEIAAVLGLSTWESAFSLWHRKNGTVPPREANTEMEAGRRLEPVICEVFAERHPELHMERGGTFRNRQRAYQIANPDQLAYLDGLLAAIHEAKFALYPDGWGEEGTDQVPPYYQAQCRWYGDVFGLTRTYLTVFIGSTGEFREYVIDADEQDAALMRERAEAFMASLAAGRQPPIDGHDATFRAVKAIPDGIEDVDVEVTPQMKDEYYDALDAFTAAEGEKRRAAAVILDAIGTGRRATCLSERVATRTVRNGKTFSLQPARNRGDQAA